MKLKDISIACDQCGRRQVDEFVYFSIDFNNITPATSFDICLNCCEQLKKTLVANGVVNKLLHCDMCGSVFVIKSDAIVGPVSQVRVSLASGIIICASCHKHTKDTICGCGSQQRLRQAQITVESEIFELCLCKTDYIKWIDQQNLVQQQWQ